MGLARCGALAIVAWLILPSVSHGDDWDAGEVATCISTDRSIKLDEKLHTCDGLIALHIHHFGPMP